MLFCVSAWNHVKLTPIKNKSNFKIHVNKVGGAWSWWTSLWENILVSMPTSSYIFQNKSSCASFNRTIKWQYQCSESTLCGQKFADTCWCAAVTASNLFPAVRRFIFQIMFEVNKLFFMEVNTEITSLSDYSFINLFFSVKYWIVSPLQVSGDQWNSQTLKLCGEVTHRYCIIIRVLEGLDVVINRGASQSTLLAATFSRVEPKSDRLQGRLRKPEPPSAPQTFKTFLHLCVQLAVRS